MTRRATLLSYGRQWIDDDDVQAVVEQLRSDWLTQGPTVARFEAALCSLTGAKYAVAVSSGTAALHLSALAAGVGPGDVGLTSDITFVASANGMRYAGAKAVLVDVDPDTGLVACDQLAERAAALAAAGTPPKIIVPVDLAGSVADLPRVQGIARDYGAMVVEDAAHSLGATYEIDGAWHRAASCAHSDMAILSFHPVKHLTTAEGGAVTTNNTELFEHLCRLRSHGIPRYAALMSANDGPWYYEQVELGFHYRLSDVQCALGLSQVAKFSDFLDRRREIAARYDQAFAASYDVLRPLRVPPRVRSAYHLYVVQLVARLGETTEALASRRKALFIALRERNIGCQVHYIPLHRQPDFRRSGSGGGDFAGAERYYAGCVSLPMFPLMTDSDVDDVIDAVRESLA